jgi:hypothetical protein
MRLARWDLHASSRFQMVGSSLAGIVYDAQYTSSDTGLIYMRNRVYDPATAQFGVDAVSWTVVGFSR